MLRPLTRMLAPLTLLTVVPAVPIAAQGFHVGQRNLSLREFTDALPENFRFVLLRSYLPTGGRDSVTLPTISVKAIDQDTGTALPECPWGTTSLGDFKQAERAIASEKFSIRDVVKTIAKIIKLRAVGPAPYCAWWFVVDNQTFNIAYPDSNATYWATPFIADPDTELVIEGECGSLCYVLCG
jgi:hypothetical protein